MVDTLSSHVLSVVSCRSGMKLKGFGLYWVQATVSVIWEKCFRYVPVLDSRRLDILYVMHNSG